MEPNIKETIDIKEETKDMNIAKNRLRSLIKDRIVEDTKLRNREISRDLSKSTLVDTTLKKSGKYGY